MNENQIGELWLERLKESKYKTLESFLEYFTSEYYNYTREELLNDIEFYIDELLGYNEMEEPETVPDDEGYDDMRGWD